MKLFSRTANRSVFVAVILGMTAFFTLAELAWGQDWYNPDWGCRKQVTISGLTEDQTDYQVKVPVSFVTGKMNEDFSDLRFTLADGTTLIDHWMESYTSSDAALFWVEVPSILAAGSTIYMYYGNSTATSASNGDATFLLFDDFEDGTIDTDKWLTYGIIEESDGYLKLLEKEGTQSPVLKSNTTYTYKAMRTRIKFFGFQEDAGERWIGWGNLLAYHTQGKPFANIYTGMSADAPVDAMSADADIETTAGIKPRRRI